MKEKEDSFTESNRAMVTEEEENEMSEGEAGRLTELITCCSGMGPTKSKTN